MNICMQLRRFLVSLLLVLAASFSALAQQFTKKTIAEDILTLSNGSIELPMDVGTAMLVDIKLTDEAVEYFYKCKTEDRKSVV